MDVHSYRQLRAGGVPKWTLQTRAQGSWSRPFRGVYVTTHTPEMRDLMGAAVSAAGASAVLSHRSAALVHGLAGLDGLPGFWMPAHDDIEVTIPTRRSLRQRPGLQVRRCTLESSDVVHLGDLALTSVRRTIEDLLLTYPRDPVVVAVDDALARGLIRPQDVRKIARNLRGRPGSVVGCANLALVSTKSESAFETLSRLTFRDRGLRPLVVQPRIRNSLGRELWRPDFGFGSKDRVTVLGEADGLRDHSGIAARARDAEREEELRMLGFEVVRWLWVDLVRKPDSVVARIRRFLALPLPGAPVSSLA